MHLSDLQKKEVINVSDGKRIGNIVDVIIESSNGRMKSLILETNKNMRKIFNAKEEYEIVWEQIIKIGEDVILVKIE